MKVLPLNVLAKLLNLEVEFAVYKIVALCFESACSAR
jgi:hypothetical protein